MRSGGFQRKNISNRTTIAKRIMDTDKIPEFYKKVLYKNTFYYFNQIFEKKYEEYINSITNTLIFLKKEVDEHGLKKEIFSNILLEKENGMRELFALNGLSNESLKRIITILRITQDQELKKLMVFDKWHANNHFLKGNIKELTDHQIQKMIRSNPYFREGIINLFWEGDTVPFLVKTIPFFELKKSSIDY